VTRVYVDFNDRVEEGQLLAEIDPEQPLAAVDEASARVAAAEAGIQQAKATLEETRLTLAQAEAQAKEGLISQRDLNTARAAAERAKASLAGASADATLARASLKSARAKLGRTKIISPARGVVLSRQVEPGQTVTAGFETPILFKVAEDLTQMRLHVYVDEADVGRVREGQDATFTVDAFPGRTFPSKVLSLRNEPRTEQNVVSYEALLAVDNKELLLRPGMTATATIITEARKDVLLVPNAALRFAPPAPPSGFGPPTAPQGPEGPRVWVLEGNEPVAVSVTPGPSDGRMTEITGGALQVGQRVLTDVAEVP
jgi:HlyD family secretion protein